MASITIIGGTGLVGKEIFRMGTKAGLRLTSVTSTGALYGSNPWLQSDKWWEEKVKFVKGDVHNIKEWNPKLYEDRDAVIYVAGLYKNRPGALANMRDVNYEGPLICAEMCKKYGVDKFVYMSCAGKRFAPQEALDLKWQCERELLEKKDDKIVVLKPGHVFSGELFLGYFQGIYFRHKWAKNPNVPGLYHAIRTRELANVTLHSALDPKVSGLIEGEDLLVRGIGESSKFLFEYASEVNGWKL